MCIKVENISAVTSLFLDVFFQKSNGLAKMSDHNDNINYKRYDTKIYHILIW